MKNTVTKLDAKIAKGIYTVHIPPVEWLVRDGLSGVGKLKNGRLLFVDHWRADSGKGWVVHVYKDFAEFESECDIVPDADKVLVARKLGIKTHSWEGIEIPIAEWLMPGELGSKEHRAYLQRRIAQYEAAGLSDEAEKTREIIRRNWPSSPLTQLRRRQHAVEGQKA